MTKETIKKLIAEYFRRSPPRQRSSREMDRPQQGKNGKPVQFEGIDTFDLSQPEAPP